MKKDYGMFALRIGIGGLFLIAGLMKLMNPGMVKGMLGTLGFPMAAFFAWLLILSELVCGAAVIVGYQMKYATLPLGVILVLGMFLAPGENMQNAMTNAALLSAVIALWFGPAGAWALKPHRRR